MVMLIDTMQEKCVAKIMKHLCKDIQDAERREVLEYGLKCFVGEGIKIAFLLLIYGLAGVFWEFFFAFASLLAVRRFIGGSHSNVIKIRKHIIPNRYDSLHICSFFRFF